MNGPGLDPALYAALRGALSLLFLSSAAHKLRDRAAFRTAVERYELVPRRWSTPFAAALAGAELVIAALLLLPGLAVAALAAAALLAIYTAAIAINLWRGRRDVDCGCGGPAGQQPLAPPLLARNLMLIGVCLATVPAVSSRPLVWLDGLTVVAGVAVLAILYAAADTALANARNARPRAHPEALDHA